jgi:hypothetical protein
MMNYRFFASAVFKVAIAVFALVLFLAPRASAETIGISSFTACGGGTTCIGGFAYSLSALEAGTQSISLTSSAVYQLDNDTPSGSFTLPFDVNLTINGPLAFNESLDCQTAGILNASCSISGALGTFSGVSATYGPPAGLVSGDVWNPGATITFSGLQICGANADECRFDLTVTPSVRTPEPSSLVLLATGLVALLGLAYRKS